jgi:hypothetical protein
MVKIGKQRQMIEMNWYRAEQDQRFSETGGFLDQMHQMDF